MEEQTQQAFTQKHSSQCMLNKENMNPSLNEERPNILSKMNDKQSKYMDEIEDVIQLMTEEKELQFKKDVDQINSECQALLKAYLFIQNLNFNNDKVQKFLLIFQNLDQEQEKVNFISNQPSLKNKISLNSSKLSFHDNCKNFSQLKKNGKISLKFIKSKQNLISIRCFNDSLILTSKYEFQNRDKLTNQKIINKNNIKDAGSLLILRQTDKKVSGGIEQKQKQQLVQIDQSDKELCHAGSDDLEINGVKSQENSNSSNLLYQQKSSSLFSSGAKISIKDINLPRIAINQEFINRIFQNCSIFLINLSFCLMTKFATKNREYLLEQNICWLLNISTIISFKIYYDEYVQDLIQYYSDIINLDEEDTIFLQKWFLEKIDYKVVINGRYYQQMMDLLIQIKML